MTGAERQRAYRDRKRQEARRAALRGPEGPCGCCGESQTLFLVQRPEGVFCRNCAGPLDAGLICPHRGILRRVGR